MKPNPCHPTSDDAIRRLKPLFDLHVTARLYRGADQYGDASFERPPTELLREISEECLDLAGWGFVLWCRVQELIQELNERGT